MPLVSAFLHPGSQNKLYTRTFISLVYKLLPAAPPEKIQIPSVQFSSVAQSCPTPCNPMNCSTPGLPVHHQLPKFTQTHIHRVKCMLMIYPQSSSKKSFKLLHCFQKKIQSDLRVRHNLVPIYLFNLICYHFNQSIPLTYQALSCPRTFAHTSPCV